MSANKPPEIVHCLYVGVTQSGKTTLARAVSRQFLAKKTNVAVFDPLGTSTAGGDWGEGALIFTDAETFLNWIYSPEAVNYQVFVDEAHKVLGHLHPENFWMLTEGRHFFLTLHLMTQRPKKLHPDVRHNCGRCYMFRLSKSDRSEIGADYGFDDLDKLSLDKGDFLVLNSGTAKFDRGNVFQLLE
jgi:DNA helicase HerA-like ATPase